jgi:hypothetical protein
VNAVRVSISALAVGFGERTQWLSAAHRRALSTRRAIAADWARVGQRIDHSARIPPVIPEHECGHAAGHKLVCAYCGDDIIPRSVRTTAGPAATDEKILS